MQLKQKTTIIEQLSAATGRLTTAGDSTHRNAFAAHQSRASVAPNSSVQQPRDNQANEHREDSTAKARCGIPAEPVSNNSSCFVAGILLWHRNKAIYQPAIQ